MMFFELMETAQAILVSLILTDGSAQAVLHALDALKVVIRNLLLKPTTRPE
ncbi:cell division protein FtsL [Rothia dentocariosa]|uniref:cell division protein FtsL n=1 Tax=Rothia dentocariosa TaxID=2047 RepID=UPI0028D59344|nr:cell division protein FtsL [Rothia dentocariosa]